MGEAGSDANFFALVRIRDYCHYHNGPIARTSSTSPFAPASSAAGVAANILRRIHGRFNMASLLDVSPSPAAAYRPTSAERLATREYSILPRRSSAVLWSGTRTAICRLPDRQDCR
jgi:hypothetical protein